MALLFQEKIEGIQLGKEQDKCFMCEREAYNKKRESIQEGLLVRKEIFLLNLNGLRHCLCMDHFKELLGDYTLISKEEKESMDALNTALAIEDTDTSVAERPEEFKEEVKTDEKKTSKAAKPSKGK